MSKTVYPYTYAHAKNNGDVELWRESHKQNVLCAAAVEKAIEQGFDGMSLGEDAAAGVIREFGYDRVNWVMANTVTQLKDPRFSHNNKTWAAGFFIEPDMMAGMDVNRDFVVSSHPAILDIFTNQARRAYQELGLFDASHCEDKTGLDLKGQVAVLNPTCLRDEYKSPADQLFIPDSGFGCSPTASGRRVYGTFLKDGERGTFYRQDFIGVLKDEFLPDWAREKLEKMQQKTEAPEQGQIMS